MHEPTEPTEPTGQSGPLRRLADSVFLPALLLQVCAFTALALGWTITAGVCWILFFGYVLFLITKQAEEAATSRKREPTDETRGHRAAASPSKRGQAPARKSWRARRRAFFEDWPGGPEV